MACQSDESAYETELRQELERVRAEKRELMSKQFECQQQLKTANDRQENINQRLADIAIRKAEQGVSVEMDQLLKENTRLKTSLTSATTASRKQRNEKLQLIKENEQLKQELSNVRLEVQIERDKDRDWQQKCDDKDQQIAQLRSSLSDVKSKSDEKIKSLRKELASKTEELLVSTRVTEITRLRQLDQEKSAAFDAQDMVEELKRSLKKSQGCKPPPTEHVALIGRIRDALERMLSTPYVAMIMYQRNALTLRELEEIQSKRDKQCEAARILLDIVVKEAREVYECFVDVLKESNQKHVYEFIVNSSYSEYNPEMPHTSLIRDHYTFLFERLDVEYSNLAHMLWADNVINLVEKEDIVHAETSTRQNERLLSVLSRKSGEQFQLFLDALDRSGQSHVRNKLSGRKESVLPESSAKAINSSDGSVVQRSSSREELEDYRRKVIELEQTNSELEQELERVGAELRAIGEQRHCLQLQHSDELERLSDRSRQLESLLAASKDEHRQLQEYTKQLQMHLETVSQNVDEWPEQNPVWGLTSLDDELFVLCQRSRDQIEVYDMNSYNILRHITLNEAESLALCTFSDMTSCQHNRCLYIADQLAVHRVDLQDAVLTWSVLVGDRQSLGLSVTPHHTLLVTCSQDAKLKEFTTDGTLLREIDLKTDVVNPWQALQVRDDKFLICHGSVRASSLHRVCIVDARGSVELSFGSSPIGQQPMPRHLAVDSDGFVFVVDMSTRRRLLLLGPTLDYVREIWSPDSTKSAPQRLFLDAARRRLYVAMNEYNKQQDVWVGGRVLVLSV